MTSKSDGELVKQKLIDFLKGIFSFKTSKVATDYQIVDCFEIIIECTDSNEYILIFNKLNNFIKGLNSIKYCTYAPIRDIFPSIFSKRFK